jgi:hypothetical protein
MGSFVLRNYCQISAELISGDDFWLVGGCVGGGLGRAGWLLGVANAST